MIFFQPPPSRLPVPASVERLEVVTPEGLRLEGWLRPASPLTAGEQRSAQGAADAAAAANRSSRAGDAAASANRSSRSDASRDRPGDRAPLLLYFGGNAEEVSATVFDRRWPADWSVAAFNYRGYGASEGRPSERALAADALQILDAMLQRSDIDAGRIVLFGRSLGTAVAVKLAAERAPAGVVLASPFDSLVAVGRGHYPWLPVRALLRHRFEAAEHARRVNTPLLALVAKDDWIVPTERSRALADAWAGPVRWRVIDGGADHNTLAMFPGFWSEVATFLTEVAASGEKGPTSATGYPADTAAASGVLAR